MSHRPTQNERLLAVLVDGQPHSFHELLREVPCIVHSRISELRARGHRIECWRDRDAYLYRLLSPSCAEPQAPSLATDRERAAACGSAHQESAPASDTRRPPSKVAPAAPGCEGIAA